MGAGIGPHVALAPNPIPAAPGSANANDFNPLGAVTCKTYSCTSPARGDWVAGEVPCSITKKKHRGKIRRGVLLLSTME